MRCRPAVVVWLKHGCRLQVGHVQVDKELQVAQATVKGFQSEWDSTIDLFAKTNQVGSACLMVLR